MATAGQSVRGVDEILRVNLFDQRAAVVIYRKILAMIKDNEKDFPDEFETLEHDVRLANNIHIPDVTYSARSSV